MRNLISVLRGTQYLNELVRFSRIDQYSVAHSKPMRENLTSAGIACAGHTAMMDYVIAKEPKVAKDRYLDVVLITQPEQRDGLWAQHLFPPLVDRQHLLIAHGLSNRPVWR